MSKESNIPPFVEEGLNSFKQFKFPNFNMDAFIGMYQKNLELMNKNQQIAVETAQSILELQNQYLKNAFDLWGEQAKKFCSKASLEEKTSSHAEATKETVDKTMEHFQNLNTIIAKSNEVINDSIQKRFKEGLEESANLAKKNKAAR